VPQGRDRFASVAAWDTRVSLALQARRSSLPNFFFSAFSWSGAGGVWFALAGILWLASTKQVELFPRQVHFLIAMTAALAALIVGGIIKRLARRRRPFATERGITRAIWAPGPARSFPSTHAATSIALAVALLMIAHPLAPLVAFWAIGVSFSRVWLGVHFASDVLSGAALGVLFGLVPWTALL
jgi:membrane-associated phospholipid phosphatase